MKHVGLNATKHESASVFHLCMEPIFWASVLGSFACLAAGNLQ